MSAPPRCVFSSRRALVGVAFAAALTTAPACRRSEPISSRADARQNNPAPVSSRADTRQNNPAPDASTPAPLPRGPVASLEGLDLQALRRMLGPGQATPGLIQRIATLLDDQDGGRDDRIDAGLEALHLASFLLHQAPQALPPRHRLTPAALKRYRSSALPHRTRATKLASRLSYDSEGRSLAQSSHHDKTARYWQPHFTENKRRIMQAVALMKRRKRPRRGRPLVMALGAGSCADIPLKELVQAGCDVILVDLDEASLKQGIAMQLTPAQRRHVRLELRDLSGGVVDAISRQANSIIRRHAAKGASAARTRAALNALFKRQRASVPQLDGGRRVDLLLSSLLIGQLPIFPAQTIGDWFQRQFKQPLISSKHDMLAQSTFGDRLFDAHIEALGDFVLRTQALVYFSSDLFMMPSFYELSSGKMRYGPSRPVMGYHGKPILDLDLPFEGKPGLKVISGSSGGQKSSDFWIWDQEPAQLANEIKSIAMKGPKGAVRRTGKKGVARAVDAVILVPAL